MRKMIKDFDLSDRPREKLIKEGSDSLSDEELLAIILSTGTKEKNAIELAREILANFSYQELYDIEVNELTKINGIKAAKASKIVASLKFGKRIAKRVNQRSITKIEKSEDIYNFLKEDLADKKNEFFYAILLDTKNVIISKELVSKGTLDVSLVHPREAFRPAIKKSAKSIIFVHNHPSGNPKPSAEDYNITRRLVDAGNLLDINVLDHIIIGENDYYSFKKENDI